MKRFLQLGLLSTVLALPVVGLAVTHPRPRVVATLPDLWTLTRSVTGGALDVEVVAPFGRNPHDMEIRPSQILLVKRASILTRNGIGEDDWIDPIVQGSGNPKLLRGSRNVIEAGHGIQILKPPSGPIDRSLGDVHPLGNPHYNLDPANVSLTTANIAGGLSRVMPDLARTFEVNRLEFLQRVAAANRRWKTTLAPYRGAEIVSFHDSFPYFYRAFGLEDGGIIEDRPGVPPSPQHLAALIRQMKDEKVKVILLETWFPPDAANLVARETGAQVVVVPSYPGAVKGTEDYIPFIDYLVNAVTKALG